MSRLYVQYEFLSMPLSVSCVCVNECVFKQQSASLGHALDNNEGNLIQIKGKLY